jgi:hypothetical protein
VTVTLGPSEWRDLTRLPEDTRDYAPLALRVGVNVAQADRLVRIGLAEKGLCKWGFAPQQDGYRLSILGIAVRERGRFPRTR